MGRNGFKPMEGRFKLDIVKNGMSFEGPSSPDQGDKAAGVPYKQCDQVLMPVQVTVVDTQCL